MFSYAVPEGRHSGYGIVTDRFVLAVGEHFPLPKVIELWEILLQPTTEIEDALTALAESGIANLPDFALVELVDASTGSVTVAVRGDGMVQVGGSSPRIFAGTGAVTWIEASAQRITELVMSVGAAQSEGIRLPFKRGVVRTDHMYWGVPLAISWPETPNATEAPDDATVLSSYQSRKRDQVAGSESSAQEAAASEPAVPEVVVPEVVVPEPVVPEPVDDATVLSNRRTRSKLVWQLRFESGRTLTLDTAIVVGRRPKVPAEADTQAVQLDSPTREVSGTHAQITPEADAVVLTDLASTNGTVVTVAGAEPVLVRWSASIELREGDRVDFGDGNIAMLERESVAQE